MIIFQVTQQTGLNLGDILSSVLTITAGVIIVMVRSLIKRVDDLVETQTRFNSIIADPITGGLVARIVRLEQQVADLLHTARRRSSDNEDSPRGRQSD